MIRFGLAYSGAGLERWQRFALETLLALPEVELLLAVTVPDAQMASRVPPHPRRLASLCRPDSLEIREVSDLVVGCESISCAPSRGGASAGWADAASRVASLELDFILNLGVLGIAEPMLSAPRWGVWTFDQDDQCRSRGEPPDFRPVLGRRLTTELSLSRLGSRAGDARTLRWGRFRTVRSNYRVHVDRVYPIAAEWPAQMVQRLRRDPGALDNSPVRESTADAPISSAWSARGFAFRLLGRRLRRSIRRQFQSEEWNVGWIRAPIEELREPAAKPKIVWLKQPRGVRFWADPFGVEWEGRRWVFFEVLDAAGSRGRIAAGPVEEGGLRTVTGVWRWPHHASYPFLFEHAGELFCVPETSKAGVVRLYRSQSLPAEWTEVATLLRGVAVVDASIFRFEGRWWMTCADARGDAATELLIFYADELTGPWRPHAMNPVKVDVASARPGGTPFEVDGVLYRPAQDCSNGYGARIVVQEIERLNELEFEEHTVGALEPDPDGPFPDGLHTMSEFSGWTLVDGKRLRFDWLGPPKRLLSRLAAGGAPV